MEQLLDNAKQDVEMDDFDFGEAVACLIGLDGRGEERIANMDLSHLDQDSVMSPDIHILTSSGTRRQYPGASHHLSDLDSRDGLRELGQVQDEISEYTVGYSILTCHVEDKEDLEKLRKVTEVCVERSWFTLPVVTYDPNVPLSKIFEVSEAADTFVPISDDVSLDECYFETSDSLTATVSEYLLYVLSAPTFEEDVHGFYCPISGHREEILHGGGIATVRIGSVETVTQNDVETALKKEYSTKYDSSLDEGQVARCLSFLAIEEGGLGQDTERSEKLLSVDELSGIAHDTLGSEPSVFRLAGQELPGLEKTRLLLLSVYNIPELVSG
jgi:hypothetical protein